MKSAAVIKKLQYKNTVLLTILKKKKFAFKLV